MPRHSKVHVPPRLKPTTLVLDNGAYTMKAGLVQADQTISEDTPKCHMIPNCIARGYDARRHAKYYVADQLETCKDFEQMGFKRPVERGYVVNWDSEMDIWKQALFNPGSKVEHDPHETNLLLTEAPNCPFALQTNTDQIIFEELEYFSANRSLAPSLNAYNPIPTLFSDPAPHSSRPAECLLVLDIGYSHTTITPVIAGQPLRAAMRRLDIGGKLLTNHLAELLSMRHYDLRAEPYQINQIKEAVSFVSSDFSSDLERTWKGTSPARKATNDLTLEYVLPDWHHTFAGTIRAYDASASVAKKLADRKLDPTARERFAKLEDSFPICNERFVVPELLFSPADIGMPEAGIPEAVVQVLAALPRGLWPGLLANVLVVGGTAKIPGLVRRLEQELRALVPADLPLRVRAPEGPVTYTWLGGARLAVDEERFKSMVVTREEYLEFGANWTTRRFNGL